MKKNILFVMNDLNCGGSQKALISMLETINYSLYDVDLFLLDHKGIFMSKIPKEVNLLPEPENYKYFNMPIKKALIELVKDRNLKLAFFRILAGYIFKTEKNITRSEQRVWKYLRLGLKNIEKKYDVAIGFQEKNPIYFTVDKVNAEEKIGWIHTDYSKIGIDIKIEKPYFKKLDFIITVSNELLGILKNMFPSESHKFNMIHNIVSPKIINKMLLEQIDLKNNNNISIISMGRLVEAKGFEIAVEACNILIRKGYSLKWYVVGEGGLRGNLEKMIREKNLQDSFILLGLKENPYPYIRQADIYVQTSIFEGKSIALDEAKILCKPIVTTNFTSAKNQIDHNINGFITQINPISVAEAIEKLINDKELSNKFIDNLEKSYLGTENEINKLYQLINSNCKKNKR
ncbi:glycosyl transferase [Clostridium polyendosporum]|uniref:Glycosyl transferase n=1 Tax=Clostridium polyendosporum TaxID=69208 RepID=A0A919VFT0_9CLOT|nr:glycosyltransferase [Clostridium polyendosporum]GIM28740.1 glycosyl transferase [Clostridium polyendosporum]